MGKIKINKGGNYTVISNHVLQNNNLSLKAKGWKALYPLKNKQLSGVVSTPFNPENLASDKQGNPLVF